MHSYTQRVGLRPKQILASRNSPVIKVDIIKQSVLIALPGTHLFLILASKLFPISGTTSIVTVFRMAPFGTMFEIKLCGLGVVLIIDSYKTIVFNYPR
jgi:hypothetical protein